MVPKKFSILSFRYAFEGLVAALNEEPNLKLHLLAGFLVLILSFILQISRQDWIIIIILIGLVIAVELTNTASSLGNAGDYLGLVSVANLTFQ